MIRTNCVCSDLYWLSEHADKMVKSIPLDIAMTKRTAVRSIELDKHLSGIISHIVEPKLSQ